MYRNEFVATTPTARGIETQYELTNHLVIIRGVATTPTARGIETNGDNLSCFDINYMLQQHLPLAVCAEGCETAEEQSDDEVRTSQVPERSEGKTKAISNSTYRLRY